MRVVGLLAGVVACAITLSATAQVARAECSSDRVAVVVLAYNGDPASHASEAIFEGFSKETMGARYCNVYVVRGNDTTPDNIRAAMMQALATGHKVDFMTSTHSDGYAFYTDHFGGSPEELLSPILTPENRKQLNLAVNFGCYSSGQVDQWARLGFKSYAGHDDISTGALAMNLFLENWLACRDLQTSTYRTNKRLKNLIETQRLPHAIFHLLAFGTEYQAMFKAYGQNQRLCGEGSPNASAAQVAPVSNVNVAGNAVDCNKK